MDSGRSTDNHAQPHADLIYQIGRVAYNFSTLELLITDAVWGLIGDQQRGLRVTSGLQFKNLLDLFTSLATDHAVATNDKDLEAEAAAHHKALAKAAINRNNILHSAWMTDETDDHPWRYKPWRKEPHGEEFPVDRVAAVGDEIKAASKRTFELVARLPHVGIDDPSIAHLPPIPGSRRAKLGL